MTVIIIIIMRRRRRIDRKRDESTLNHLSIFCFPNFVVPRAWEALPGQCGATGKEGR